MPYCTGDGFIQSNQDVKQIGGEIFKGGNMEEIMTFYDVFVITILL